ncbi:hypothetical protein ACIQUB_00480 [Rhizobium sp. NPDC090275]|uniref:hypothetical protein n=1 Tax=Rhizobium sp. NPDC090275 TaxID=3364498 RepID=UPI000DDE2224
MIRLWTVTALYLANLPFADSLFVVLLTLPMFLMVLVGLYRIRSRRFQVGDVFWFCLFVYFVISPLQRMHGDRIGGATAITAYAYEPQEFIAAMLIVVLFCLPFLFVSMERDQPPAEAGGSIFPMPVLLALNSLAFASFVASEGGMERLLSSRLEQDPAQAFIGSLFFLGLQSVTACLVAVRFHAARSRLISFVPLLFVIALLAVARNPFNAPRFMLLAVWGPVMLALCGGRVAAAWFYVAGLLALTILFPILNITTRLGLDGVGDLSEISVFGNFFDIPSVDVFDMAVHAVRFMSAHDQMWGEKLVAILLFFVPRAVWAGKPVVGGLDVGNELFAAGMYGTPNLSFLAGCDLYMDFGFAGVALGGAVTAMLLRSVLMAKWGVVGGVSVLRILIASSMPILLRGPVGAVLPLFVCQIAVVLALSWPVRDQVYPAPFYRERLR